MPFQHLWRRLQGDNTTDALFRAWGSGLAAAIQATGWVKTSDTGQIDWATVAHPTVNGQKMGYEIYRPSDSLQASAPWFLRFDYGADPNAAFRMGLYLTMGSGTNGAGTLTGASGQITLSLNTQQNTAPRQWLIVGDGSQGQLGVIAGVESVPTDCGCAFWLERTQVKGVPNNQGAVLAFLGYSLAGTNRMMHTTQKWGGPAAVAIYAPMLCSIAAADQRMAGHFDTGSIVHPVFYSMGDGFLRGPVHGMFLVDNAAVPVGVITDVPHDGGTVTVYVAAKPQCYTSNQAGAAMPFQMAIRWN